MGTKLWSIGNNLPVCSIFLYAMTQFYIWLSDGVALFHLGYILFVLMGLAAILLAQPCDGGGFVTSGSGLSTS